MNSPCFGRAMHEKWSALGTSHSETVDPVDASNSLILLTDTTRWWLLDQRRPALRSEVTFTGIYWDVHEQAAIVAVPDSNEITSGCRNSVTMRRVFRCIPWSNVCATSKTVAVQLCDAMTSRVGREIDAKDGVVILPVREDLFECFCVPHNTLVECPRCDPSAILGHGETEETCPGHCCHLFAVFHSPHFNFITPADDVLAVRCKCHCPYKLAAVDFNERGTLFSKGQHRCNSISPLRTGHCRRRIHQRHCR